ncbi:SGNH/GDSL hydrolase family protein [Terrabacter carboxydivorans]|uniref:SGNH hydrolase-type esterase domain-containing protein n=1 Tax=Terrabacter carboxydivorans TaxID=619730 RepID=A0ABN3KS08_9MICO
MPRSPRTTRLGRAAAALVVACGTLAATAALAPVTSASATTTPQVVQLGDSYSAGNGTGTYEERDCYRSPDNYGSQVATSIGASYTDVACSGGVVADILHPRDLGNAFTKSATYSIDPAAYPDQQSEWLKRAQTERLCGVPAQPDFSYRYTFVAGAGVNDLYTGTVSCQLTTRAQIDAVTPDTDYVFVTIGGNDIGFSTIVVDCLTLRDPTSCKQALDAATAKAPQMVESTKDALRAVEQKSGGHAQVYLLSYPFLINTESYGIPEAAPVYDAGKALNDLQRLGDQLQAQGIAELNAEPGAGNYHFVDTVKQAWGGRVHGLDPHVVADNSRAWLVPVGTPGRDTAEFVHPTQPGWDATAGALRTAVSG